MSNINWDPIIHDKLMIGVTELSKSITFFCVSKDEFENGNLPLAIYSLYYSFFHAAQFRLIIEYNHDIIVKDWISDDKEKSKYDKKKSTPWSHNQIFKLLKLFQSEDNFLTTLKNSRHLREFYSYGPKIYRVEIGGYGIFVSEHKELCSKINDMYNTIEEFYYHIPNTVLKKYNLQENFLFAQYLWQIEGGYLERFEYPLKINRRCLKIIDKIISDFEKYFSDKSSNLKVSRIGFLKNMHLEENMHA